MTTHPLQPHARTVAADDKVRDDVERTRGAWAQMTPEQREQLRARVHEKKQHADAARGRKEAGP